MSVRYILDACALIALLKDEAGAEEVSAIFNEAFKGEALISMNKINLLVPYGHVSPIKNNNLGCGHSPL
jgi:PIN domain nuclease of toxin-antitoxin system